MDIKAADSAIQDHATSVSRAGRRRGRTMTGLIERTLGRLDGQLPGRVSRPGDNRYVAATALWAKAIGRMPRAVVHLSFPKIISGRIDDANRTGLAW